VPLSVERVKQVDSAATFHTTAGELNAVGFPSDSTVRDKSWWSHRHVRPAELWRRRHAGPSPGKGEVQCFVRSCRATRSLGNEDQSQWLQRQAGSHKYLAFDYGSRLANAAKVVTSDHRNYPAGSLSTTSCWRRRWEKKPSTTLFNVISRVQDHRCARLRVTRLLPSRQRSPSCIRNLW
jgi:hypothetical protein